MNNTIGAPGRLVRGICVASETEKISESKESGPGRPLLSTRTCLLILFGINIAYVLAFILLLPEIGASIAILTVLPVIIAGFLFGLRGGLHPGDRFFVYTDGVYEVLNSEEKEFGVSRLLDILSESGSLALEKSLFSLKEKIDAWRGGRKAEDDITILAGEIVAE